jgi:glycosyltransferase involved in cell wall biosynthesis
MSSLGLVIPTLNSRRYLRSHVDGLLPWLDLVREIVVVDSYSSDGSAEFLRDELRHPGLRILQHQPGIYASWNAGIKELQTDYFIMSTTGDTMEREGVEALLRCAGEGDCDVVLSKPVFVDMEGKTHGKHWPVDAILAGVGAGESRFFSGLEALAYAIAQPNSALLGSSASNLYRTEFFRERPFPLDWGVSGDAGWVWRYVAEARWGAVAGDYSRFLLHPPQSDAKDLRPQVVHRADRTLRESVAVWLESGIVNPGHLAEIGWDPLLECLQRYLNLKEGFDAVRRSNFPWILNPVAWWQRCARSSAFSELRLRSDRALMQLQKKNSVII